MDLKDYQPQIKELISLSNDPDIESLFDTLLLGESNSNKFLIKMELTRLTKPSQRIIDLRDKVTEPCQIFDHAGLKHYLTADAIDILKKNIELYGLYTVGVFEAVNTYIAQKKEKKQTPLVDKKSLKKQDQCDFIQLSQKNKRAAARMFFVSGIEISQTNKKILIAHTSNVSSTGIKIKVKENVQFTNQEIIQIIFTELQREYRLPALENKISYRIVKQDIEEGTHYLYLEYADNKTQFVTFIKEFIRENQHKYKIDIHYYYLITLINALKIRYLEQMNSLPIYLDNQSASPFLFALKNQANSKLLDEWTCNNINQLPILFNELRLTKLLANAPKIKTTTIYSFNHQGNENTYFLSATDEELIDKGLKNLFINYGSKQISWRVYHLTLIPYKYRQNQDYDITEALPQKFASITHLATLEPLSQTPILTTNHIIKKNDLNKINQFIHHQEKTSKSAIFNLCSNELRKEERYLYKSALSLSSNGTQYSGVMIDFSLTGLKIRLGKMISIPSSRKVTINLLALQNVSNKYPLSALSYKVVRTGPHNTLHLQVCDSETLDICRRFFSLLIENNPSHFKCVQLKSKKQPVAKRLIEITEESFNNCVFFVGKEAGRPKIKFGAIDKMDSSLYRLFSMCSDNSQELNYSPLINKDLYEHLLAQPFKENKKSLLFKEVIIYIQINKKINNKWVVNSFLNSNFKSEKEKIEFILNADKNATFYALNYRLSALNQIDLSSIEADLHQISRFALHLTKKLEEQLFDIKAMIEITDRTSDILKSIKKGNDRIG